MPPEYIEPVMDTWGALPLEDLVAALVAGSLQTAQPTVLERSDGRALFYPGKVNGVHGDSGSGKSWTALHACAQQINAGKHVTFVDLEDSPSDVVARLIALEVPPAAIVARFHYVQPEAPFITGADAFLSAIAVYSPTLVVIDSTGESLSIEGKNPNADEEIAAWFREVPKRISKTGPAVVILDHMPKSSDSDLWPIGSQRKRAAIDGAQYLQEVMSPFSKEKAGAAKLVCAKDRHGNYARGEKVAVLNVTPMPGRVVLSLASADAGTNSSEWKPTGFMERVSRALEGVTEPLTFNAIADRVTGKRTHIRSAVDALVREQYIATTPGPRGSTLHVAIRAYSELTDSSGNHSLPQSEAQATDDRFRFLDGEPGTSHLTESRNQLGTTRNQWEVKA